VGGVRLVWFVVVGVVALAVAAIALILILHTTHQVPMQYVGSPSGFEGFVPSGQTVSYKGSQDPVGDLILSNGTVIHDAVWNGQYSNTIIQNHNQIVQLNNQLNGDMQDFYIIKGQVPIEQATINGQLYTVIDANKINPANIAGFYTYDKWIPNFVVAMNTQGTYAAGLPGNSPVFQWKNLTGTVAYQTMIYGGYGAGPGGYVLVLPNKTIIPYGIPFSPAGSAIPFDSPQQTYNIPS
jgi:hypothetical protein